MSFPSSKGGFDSRSPLHLIKMHNNCFEKILKSKSDFLITGAPGTGKTNVLLNLVKYLIIEKNIPEDHILVFAFNRKNSKSIREEVARMVGRSIFEIPIVTVYSFCSDLINHTKGYFLEKNILLQDKKCNDFRNKLISLGYQDIEIVPSTKQWEYLKIILSSLDKKKYYKISRIISGNDHIFSSFMHEIFDFILKAQENLLLPEELLKKSLFFDDEIFLEIVGVYKLFKKEIEKRRLYNYGRLLIDSFYILNNFKDIRDHYHKKYEILLIDESQEINRATLEIIKLLSNGNAVFFGNDDESIFGFRNAISNNFKKIYSLTEKKNIICLGKNYRNSPKVHEMCTQFISNNKMKVMKNKKPLSINKKEGEVAVKSFYNFSEEVDYITDRIHYLKHVKGISYDDMAIILKGIALQSHMIEDALSVNKIPFERRSSRTVLDDRFSRKIMSFMRVVSIIRTAADKESIIYDKELLYISIKNILLSDLYVIDPIFFQSLEASHKKDQSTDFWQFLCFSEKAKDHKEIKRFIELADDFSKKTSQNPFDFVSSLMQDQRFGLYNIIKNTDAFHTNQLSNFFDFLKSLRDFGNRDSDIKDYLNFIESLADNQFIEEIEEGIKGDDLIESVKIISFHQCKGLEFEAVFIPFLNKGYIPSIFSVPQAYDLRFLNKSGNEEFLRSKHLEEERKLIYIGMSRAKSHAYITCNQSGEKSLFFKELVLIANGIKKTYKQPVKIEERKDYYSSHDRWLIRKKAVVSKYKQHQAKHIDKQRQRYLYSFLKRHYDPSNWWALNHETINNLRPAAYEVHRFSYSTLQTYLDCPLKYKFRFFLKIEQERENLSMLIGNIYHRIIKEFHDLEEKSWPSFETIIKRTVKSYDFNYYFLQKEILAIAMEELKLFYFDYYDNDYDKLMTEKKFNFDLFEDHITGRVDLIKFKQKNLVEIIDFKTRAKNYSKKELDEDIQLKLYMLAAEMSPDLNELKDKEIILKYYCFGDIKNPEISLSYDKKQKEEFIRSVGALINSIRKEEFKALPKDYFACSNCDYKIFCERFYGNKI